MTKFARSPRTGQIFTVTNDFPFEDRGFIEISESEFQKLFSDITSLPPVEEMAERGVRLPPEVRFGDLPRVPGAGPEFVEQIREIFVKQTGREPTDQEIRDNVNRVLRGGAGAGFRDPVIDLRPKPTFLPPPPKPEPEEVIELFKTPTGRRFIVDEGPFGPSRFFEGTQRFGAVLGRTEPTFEQIVTGRTQQAAIERQQAAIERQQQFFGLFQAPRVTPTREVTEAAFKVAFPEAKKVKPFGLAPFVIIKKKPRIQEMLPGEFVPGTIPIESARFGEFVRAQEETRRKQKEAILTGAEITLLPAGAGFVVAKGLTKAPLLLKTPFGRRLFSKVSGRTLAVGAGAFGGEITIDIQKGEFGEAGKKFVSGISFGIGAGFAGGFKPVAEFKGVLTRTTEPFKSEGLDSPLKLEPIKSIFKEFRKVEIKDIEAPKTKAEIRAEREIPTRTGQTLIQKAKAERPIKAQIKIIRGGEITEIGGLGRKKSVFLEFVEEPISGRLSPFQKALSFRPARIQKARPITISIAKAKKVQAPKTILQQVQEQKIKQITTTVPVIATVTGITTTTAQLQELSLVQGAKQLQSQQVKTSQVQRQRQVQAQAQAQAQAQVQRQAQAQVQKQKLVQRTVPKTRKAVPTTGAFGIPIAGKKAVIKEIKSFKATFIDKRGSQRVGENRFTSRKEARRIASYLVDVGSDIGFNISKSRDKPTKTQFSSKIFPFSKRRGKFEKKGKFFIEKKKHRTDSVGERKKGPIRIIGGSAVKLGKGKPIELLSKKFKGLR